MLGNDVGYIIWGVTDGFQKGILFSSEVQSVGELNSFPNDKMRQISNETRGIGYFYGITKTSNYSFVSVYNGNLRDRVGRGAYIAITLFTKKSSSFSGNVISKLHELMDFYVSKQGDSLNLNFTKEQFEEQLKNIASEKDYSGISPVSEKQGLYLYHSEIEIEQYFKSPKIEGYNEVLFFNNTQPDLLEKLTRYEKVKEFRKYTQVKLRNYDSLRYTLYLDGQLLNTKTTDEYVCSALPNQTIKVVDSKTKITQSILVGNYNTEKNLEQLFYVEPKKPKNNFKVKMILVAVVFLIIGSIATYLGLRKPPPKIEDDVIIKDSTVVIETSTDSITKSIKQTYSTINLLDEGCIVRSYVYSQKPFIKKEGNNIWKNGSKITKLNIVGDLYKNEIVNYFNNNPFYYRVIQNKLRANKDTNQDVASWLTIEKMDQESIFNFFVEKGLLKVTEPPKEKIKISVTADARQKQNKQNITNCDEYNNKMNALKDEKKICEDEENCITEMNSKIKDLKKQYPNCSNL